uniref:hypothetical protein n=1 Tax=Cutleria multifida TaxID=74475 RepID=UPI002E773066|nr:hypothetical protein V2479_pgp044 [Cutleria multifida]WAM62652.1 hypothetical protein [Cutleria multifida]
MIEGFTIPESRPSITYYFIIASNQFLLVDEPVEEIFRERIQYCRRLQKPKDFWFISSPEFLESPQLIDIKTKLSEANLVKDNCSAVVSPNQLFITWLKLRFQNVLIGSFIAPNEDIMSPLEYKCRVMDLLYEEKISR